MNPPTFDPKTVKLAATYEAAGTLFAVCLDEPRQTLYGAGSDGGLYAVDLAAEKPKAERKWAIHDNYVSSMLLRDGVLISAGYDRVLNWSEIEIGKRIRSVPAHDGWVRKIVLTPDGRQVISVGDDMLVKVWNAVTGERVAAFAGHAQQTPEGYISALYAVAVSPDGQHVASGDRIGQVRVWELATGKTAAAFRAGDFYTFDPQKRARAIGGIRGLAFSPDSAQLAISGIGAVTNVDGFVGPCRMELWDWRKAGRLSLGQDRHQAILNHVLFAPQPPWLVAAGGGDGGGALVFWNPTTATPPHVAKPKGHLHAFVLNRDGQRLYAAGHGSMQVWNLGS
jgi:WD40 repeat protein